VPLYSNDVTKAYVADGGVGLSIIDTTVDTLYKGKNFGDSGIEMKVYTDILGIK